MNHHELLLEIVSHLKQGSAEDLIAANNIVRIHGACRDAHRRVVSIVDEMAVVAKDCQSKLANIQSYHPEWVEEIAASFEDLVVKINAFVRVNNDIVGLYQELARETLKLIQHTDIVVGLDAFMIDLGIVTDSAETCMDLVNYSLSAFKFGQYAQAIKAEPEKARTAVNSPLGKLLVSFFENELADKCQAEVVLFDKTQQALLEIG